MREIIFSGPGKNSLGTELMESVRAGLLEAAGEPLLLRGAGDAFSAGLNLKEVAALDAKNMAKFLELLDDLVLDLYTYPGPTVALVNGHAIAGGCVMVLCCDYRVMQRSPAARIGLNEVALGVRYPPRVMALVRDRVPRRHLEEVVLGAALHSPERGAELGLVDAVSDEPERVAREKLATLSSHPAESYRAAKQRLRDQVLGPTDEERTRFARDDLPAWTSEAVKGRVRAVLAR